MDLEDIQRRSREIFRIEAAELLHELEAALLALEQNPGERGAIDRVFRVMHTLKGSGATSGFEALSVYLHDVEDVFNAAREGRVRITSELIDLTLKIADVVARHLAESGSEPSPALAEGAGLLSQLLEHLPDHPSAAAVSVSVNSIQKTFAIKFRPQSDLFRHGSDPIMFLEDLRALGSCEIRGFADDVPRLEHLDPESSFLRWEIALTTDRGEDAVRSVFMFVEDDCELAIVPAPDGLAPTTTGEASWQLEFSLSEKTLASPGASASLWRAIARLGAYEILSAPKSPTELSAPGRWRIRVRTVARREEIADAFALVMDAEPEISLQPAEDSPPLASASKSLIATEANETKCSPEVNTAKELKTETLRVSSDRLDQLVNLVGELVILRSQIGNICATMPNVPAELQGAAETLLRLSSEMRDVILNVRMTPIEQTFGKFRRLVRDLSHDLSKEVSLVIEGAETEMDKTMLDALADPLMHLVRNSLDHGLETPEVRVAAGKPTQGTLRLSAEQRGDRVMVAVSDDGAGLIPEKIRAKAIERGLLTPDANPTETELFQLIFLPGFSTADKVSRISGRGVGLDVVRRQIEHLRGEVEIESARGRGATFRLSLPLTLAIIEGLMVEVDGDRYILPLSMARETIELSRARRQSGNGRNVIEVRGEWIPYLRLRDVFALTSEPPETERIAIVETENHQRLGLCVDRILGNQQTVLKSLGWLGRRVPTFSGATVLGDGRVALILDVPALLNLNRQQGIGRGGLEI